jgi:hypothetical protein
MVFSFPLPRQINLQTVGAYKQTPRPCILYTKTGLGAANANIANTPCKRADLGVNGGPHNPHKLERTGSHDRR